MRSLIIDNLHTEYRGGLSPLRVIDEVYAGIEAAGDPGNFITLVDRAKAREAAGALGAFDPVAKPLWGVPFAVKDNIDVAAMPTTAACAEFAYTAKANASVVQRLLDAGGILIGKTNLDQFATGLVGVRSPYPVPRNAVDPDLVPGGSSSGSAVVVARGLVSFALGTDTAGSGRVPAALNNIVGLKPSLGLVSTRGVVPACRSLDCVSIFALTVGDAERALDVMAAFDEQDSYSRPLSHRSVGFPPTVRLGIPDEKSREFFGDTIAAAAFEASAKDLASLGGEIVEVDIMALREVADLLYGGPWVAERYEAIRSFIEARPDVLHPVTYAIISGATKLSAADAFAGLYKLKKLQRAAARIWDRIDVLAVPTIPTVYTRADLEADPIGPNSRLGVYTNFVNLLDLCALAVPGRTRSDGRPAGVTLIAEAARDGVLALLGARLHAHADVCLGATPQILPPAAANLRATSAPPGWIEIVAVGAHMSGLPLNHELTTKGAVFLRASRTVSTYALYALPGGPPARPGLIRTTTGKGHAIEVEVWALPPEGFGIFVAGIPSPLGIGTLQLEDGTTSKGFLVEAHAITGAEEISRYGGWRRYLQSQKTAKV